MSFRRSTSEETHLPFRLGGRWGANESTKASDKQAVTVCVLLLGAQGIRVSVLRGRFAWRSRSGDVITPVHPPRPTPLRKREGGYFRERRKAGE